MVAPPQSLYRKYRPRCFADLVGQEHVTRSIRNALKAGLVSHAYLFCGPRGSGKTSLAKIIGKTVNCASPVDGEPCNECNSCIEADSGTSLDIVEIDAASNRKIDDIRHLREQVAYGPVSGSRKVYIIDEAHMLTKEASNAFLKTLEEPPPHVIFILCTTEPEAIIPTILSRCQRYDFRKLSVDACLRRLETVISCEQPLEVSQEARGFLALRGDGSMRDVLGLLDQVISYCGRKIEREDIEKTLGLVRSDTVKAVALAMIEGRGSEIVRHIEELARAGTDMTTLLNQLVEYFRSILLVKSGNSEIMERVVGAGAVSRLQEIAETVSEPALLVILRALSGVSADLRRGLMPVFAVEVGLLSAMHAVSGTPVAHPATLSSRPVPVFAGSDRSAQDIFRSPGETRPASREARGRVASVRGGKTSSSARTDGQGLESGSGHASRPACDARGISSQLRSGAGTSSDDESRWRTLVARMRKEYPLTYAFAVEARFAGITDSELLLRFDAKHSFHMSKLAEVKHEAILKKFVHEEFGPSVKPRLVIDESSGETAPRPDMAAQNRSTRTGSGARKPNADARQRKSSPSGQASAAGPDGRSSFSGSGAGGRDTDSGSTVRGRDWYEEKALRHRKVRELLEAFDAEVVSIE